MCKTFFDILIQYIIFTANGFIFKKNLTYYEL